MNCSRAAEDAHAFVAGTLGSDETDAFELHLLSCAECQQTVRLGAGSRSAFRDSTRLPTDAAITGSRSDVLRRSGFGRRLIAGGALLAAATAAFVVLGDAASDDGLTAVVAPQFDPMPVRDGDASSATAALIERGMEAYTRGDYSRAAARLAEAARTDSTAGVSFFLGASQLLVGDAREALGALRRAWTDEGGPFETDARLLGAKAWLRLGHPDSALAVLQPGNRQWDTERTSLSALADSIRARR